MSVSTRWLNEVKWDENGLVPVIAQEAETGDVLMFAWMNRDALQRTATGLVPKQRRKQFTGPFRGQQLVIEQIQTKRFETSTISYIPGQMSGPLALIPLSATGTLFFQTLMFNDLDRFVRYFDFLAARQDDSCNIG